MTSTERLEAALLRKVYAGASAISLDKYTDEELLLAMAGTEVGHHVRSTVQHIVDRITEELDRLIVEH
jgi:hypothetical protein